MEDTIPYTVRPYQEGDEEGITALFQEVFGKEITTAQWEWKYLIPGRGRIYSKVIADSAGTIIGHAGAVPLRGMFNTRPVPVFQIADVMVHPEARGFLGRRNLFDPMIKSLFEDIGKEFPGVFCYGFPGRRPYLLGKRIGVYDEIEPGTDCVIQGRQSFSGLYRIGDLDWDDKRIDGLWEKASRGLSLSLVRDRDYLSWRYATNPFFSYRLLGISFLAGLAGWAVVRDSGDEVLLVDLMTERRRWKGILRVLQGHAASRGRKALRTWLPRSWRTEIRNCVEQETEVVITNMVWKLPFQTPVVRESLYYTMGDVDIF